MQQREEASLEYFIEIFLYNIQKAKHTCLNEETVRTLFLGGIKDEFIDILNLMDSGDVSQFPIVDIHELCRRYSRIKAKSKKGI